MARLYEEQTALSKDINAKRHARSTIGDRIRASASQPDVKKSLLEEAKNLKAELTTLEGQLEDVQNRLLSLALAIPNDTHPDVPIGPESEAKVLAKHGPPPIPASPSRDHVAIGRALDLFDLEAGALVTGNSWYYLKNEGALLELALVNYAMSIAIKHGFTPVTTPDVVRSDIAARCGFQPRDLNSDPPLNQMYHIAPTVAPSGGQAKAYAELVLAGTAEIPLAGLFANASKIMSAGELPKKVVGLGHAFRAEAGARGADTRGLYRVHQFTKLELFVVCDQESSDEMMAQMRQLQEEIFGGLGLTFRCVACGTSIHRLLTPRAEYSTCLRRNWVLARIASTTWRRGCLAVVAGARFHPLLTVRTTKPAGYTSATTHRHLPLRRHLPTTRRRRLRPRASLHTLSMVLPLQYRG